MVMPFGRSDAGLECPSVCRACVVQRMRTFSCVQHVVSAIICWCSHSSGGDGDSGAKQCEFFGEQALQPAREPYRHTGTLPRSCGVAVAERVFPVLQRAWYRNARATSLSPVAAGNQVLALVRRPLSHFVNWPPSTIRYRTRYVRRFMHQRIKGRNTRACTVQHACGRISLANRPGKYLVIKALTLRRRQRGRPPEIVGGAALASWPIVGSQSQH